MFEKESGQGEADVLVNVNMIDAEKQKKYIEGWFHNYDASHFSHDIIKPKQMSKNRRISLIIILWKNSMRKVMMASSKRKNFYRNTMKLLTIIGLVLLYDVSRL